MSFLSSLFASFEMDKYKPAAKMSSRHLQMVQSKRNQNILQSKRDIGKLIQSGEYDKARVRVEPIVRKVREVAAYELLELMCELLYERAMTVKLATGPPPWELQEQIQTVLWAAGRVAQEVPEIKTVFAQLQLKFGDTYVRYLAACAAAVEGDKPLPPKPMDKPKLADFAFCVNPTVLANLTFTAPDAETVEGALRDIAALYSLPLDEAALSASMASSTLRRAVPTPVQEDVAVTPTPAPAAPSSGGGAGGGPPVEQEEPASGGGAYTAGYADGFSAAMTSQGPPPPAGGGWHGDVSGGGVGGPPHFLPPKEQPYSLHGGEAATAALAAASADLHAGAAATPGNLPTQAGGQGSAPPPYADVPLAMPVDAGLQSLMERVAALKK